MAMTAERADRSPRAPQVLSPAQRAERAQAGMRYSTIAAAGGVICLLIMAPYVGAPLSWWAVRKARTYDNPAYIGVVACALNCIAVAVMVIIGVRLLVSA